MSHPCSNCHAKIHTESVTVRMYTRRRQIDFRYWLCADDRELLETLLEGTADAVQRGLFDHAAGLNPNVSQEQRKRRR